MVEDDAVEEVRRQGRTEDWRLRGTKSGSHGGEGGEMQVALGVLTRSPPTQETLRDVGDDMQFREWQ